MNSSTELQFLSSNLDTSQFIIYFILPDSTSPKSAPSPPSSSSTSDTSPRIRFLAIFIGFKVCSISLNQQFTGQLGIWVMLMPLNLEVRRKTGLEMLPPFVVHFCICTISTQP